MANCYPDSRRPYYGAFVHADVMALRNAGLAVDVLAIPGYLGKQEYAKGVLRALAVNGRRPYDVVHAHYGLMGLVGRLQLRAPLVVSFTGGDIQGDPDASGVLTRWARAKARAYAASAHLAAATITKSKALEEHLPPSCRDRNHVVPTGVDLSRFARFSREEARAQLGWAPNVPTVIFVADPTRPVKNFALAQAAVERLRERVPAVELRVAATVPPPDIPVWMAAADALLLTSHSEGSPNVIKEAMAAELPAVSTPVGDVPDRLRGISGCHVLPPDPDALADGLAHAVAHGRSPAAREAIADLDSRRWADKVIAIYESVARRRRG